MNKMLRGRPRLKLEQILRALKRNGLVMTPARELGCSDAYIHMRSKRAGLTVRGILDAHSPEALLGGSDEASIQ